MSNGMPNWAYASDKEERRATRRRIPKGYGPVMVVWGLVLGTLEDLRARLAEKGVKS